MIKLIIKDEVNIKIQGLPLEARKRLSNHFKYEVPGSRYHPSRRLGRWDGMVSMFGIGGDGFLSQLDQIIDILSEMRLIIDDIEDLRDQIKLEFEPITKTYWADQGVCWPEGHQLANKPIVMHEHQVTAVNTFLTNHQALQALSTASGKSLMSATLAHKCQAIGRTITIVPNKQLVRQTHADFKNVGLDVGVYYGERKDLNCTHTICTWQSLNILDKHDRDLDNDKLSLIEFLTDVNTVIVDECFAHDSKVLTPHGYIPICNINPGDIVINYDEYQGYFKEDHVIKCYSNLTNSSNEKMYELRFDNGSTIRVTGNHKFLTDHGWYRADELTTDHKIISKSIMGFRLFSICEIEKPETVYNLHIANDHNYIVEGAVVSNCHQAKSDVLHKLLTKNIIRAPIRWGMTGTIPKEKYDAACLIASIGPVVGGIQAYELQEKGILSNCHIHIKQLIDIVEFNNYQEELKYLVSNKKRLDYMATTITNIAESGNTLVLVDRIETGKKLNSLLADSFFISGTIKVKDREREIKATNKIDNKIIIATYGTCAVGIDAPRLFNIVLVEAGKSFVRVIQSIGRGIRKANDKDFVNIFDLTSTCKYSRRHLLERKKYYTEARYPFSIEKIDWNV